MYNKSSAFIFAALLILIALFPVGTGGTSYAVPRGTPTPIAIPLEECFTTSYYTSLYYVYTYDASEHTSSDFTVLMENVETAVDVPLCASDLLRSNIRVYVIHKYVYEFDRTMNLTGEKMPALEGLVTLLGTGGAEYVGMWYQVCDFVPKYCTQEGVPVPPSKLPR